MEETEQSKNHQQIERKRSIRFDAAIQHASSSPPPSKSGSFSLQSTLNEKETKMLQPLLLNRGEIAEYCGWLEKTGKNSERKILVVGQFNIFVLNPSGKLTEEAHLLELQKIENLNPDEIKLVFSNFDVSGRTLDCDAIIQAIRTSLDSSFSGMPLHLRFQIELPKNKSLPDPILPPVGPCGGYNRTYNAFIDYYQLRTQNIDKQNAIRWDIDNIFEPIGNKVFDFETLNIYSYNFRMDELLAVLTPLHFNQYFRGLVIKRMKLEKEIFLTIVMMLRLNNNMDEITLVGVNNTFKDGFIAFAESLQQNQSLCLRKLNLSENDIEDKGLESFAKHYFTSPRVEQLSSLDFSEVGATHIGISALCDAFASNSTAYKNLSLLDLSRNNIGSAGTPSLAKMLEKATGLTTLRLSETKIKVETILEAIEKGCKKIKEIDVSFNSLNQNSNIIQKLLQSKKIQRLNLSGTNISYSLLGSILNSVIYPLALELRENKLSLEGAKVIAESSLANITDLDLSENSLKNEGFQLLAAGLQTNTSLKKLTLDKNSKSVSRSSNMLSPKSSSSLRGDPSKSSPNFNSMKSNMSSADIRSGPLSSKEGIQALARALNASNITSLSIVGGTKRHLKHDIIPLLSALAHNTSLTELNITGNQMGDEGMMELARSLHVNKTLVRIELDNNHVSAAGYIYLKNALNHNQTLCQIPFPVNDFSSIITKNPNATKELSKCFSKIEKLMESNAFKNQFKMKTLPANKYTIRQLNEYNGKLQQIIEDKDLALFFREFLHSKHSNANLSFWLEVEDYRMKSEEERKKRATEIFQKYLTPKADYELSQVDRKLRKEIEPKLSSGQTDLFDEIQEYIWAHMVLKLVPKFLKSKFYQDYQEGNQQIISRNRGVTTALLDNFHNYIQKKRTNKGCTPIDFSSLFYIFRSTA